MNARTATIDQANSSPTGSIWVKTAYWGSTGLISLLMLYSAYSYFTSDQMVAAFQHLGFPNYFRFELGIAKILGVIALLAPFTKTLREWAYAGFAITFISAFIAHTSSGDALSVAIAPIVALFFLSVSYLSNRVLQGSR